MPHWRRVQKHERRRRLFLEAFTKSAEANRRGARSAGSAFRGSRPLETRAPSRLPHEGWFIDKFEELADEDEPFFYPIRFIIY